MINKYILIGIFLSFSGLFFGLVISLGGVGGGRNKNKVSHNKERPYFYNLSREILEKKKIKLKIEGGYYLCQ